MKCYFKPEIMSNSEGVIIHCGTNNSQDKSPKSVANKIVQLAMEAKKRTQHVAVSSLVVRTDSKELDLKRARVNTLLQIIPKQATAIDICLDQVSNPGLSGHRQVH